MNKLPVYPLLGAHMSIAGGLYKAIERGESINCSAIQIFTKSNRQWHAKELLKEDIKLFIKTWQASATVSIVVAHASYLINIGSPKNDIATKSATALYDELKRAESLQIPYLILHPGASLGTNEIECLDRITTQLDHVLQYATGQTKITLEVMAGQGSNIGYTFEQLAYIRNKATYKNYIGICFDTCHAWAAGYVFNTPNSYKNLWEHFDKIIGLDHLHVIHLNDSKAALKSRKDRHAHIGEGTLGLEAFQLILNDTKLKNVPKILETPKDSLADDEKNLEILRKLIL